MDIAVAEVSTVPMHEGFEGADDGSEGGAGAPSVPKAIQRRATVLPNRTCAYCGRPFDDALPPTKEHVIGRRFVPRGCLANQWNLIVNACGPCNNDKAALEDDISAITMLPDLDGSHAVDDDRLRSESRRKAARSLSRRTGRPVADSTEETTIGGSFGQATITFNMIGPPQVDHDRLFLLARYQFCGFFYWLTYQEAERTGFFVPGGFQPMAAVSRRDWGSPHMRWFMDQVRHGWLLRLHAVCADGFFKVLLRKHPEMPVWCWAFEWNQSMRVVGFAGDGTAIGELASSLPEQHMEVFRRTATETVRMRREVPLPADQDDLFEARD